MLNRPRRFIWWVLCGRLIAFAFALGNVAQVTACGIDGVPSMSLNGRLVTINADQATKQNLAYWAPFVLTSSKPSTALRFAENESELHKSLSTQAFDMPFQWTFGDGASAKGLGVTHQYNQPGWYKVNVSYYYPPEKRWVVFDSAQVLVSALGAKADSALLSIPLVLSLSGGVLCLAALAFVGLRRRTTRGQPGSGQRLDKRWSAPPPRRPARGR
jgi:PKD domain